MPKDLLIAVTGWDPCPWALRLADALPGRAIVTEPMLDAGEADPRAIAYVLAWKPDPKRLASLPNLEAIFSLGAGVDHILALDDLPDVPVARIVSPDLTARMTEYVVWQTLHHHRRGFAYAASQGRREWRERRQPAAGEVSVGMLGFGTLGQDAGDVLKRLGFDVVGWRRSGEPVEGFEVFGADRLDAFLGRTDILVCLLPLTPDTRGVLDRSLFERLRRDGPLGGPSLVNAGRGGLQVEADILSCLEDGTLKGASLDVFEEEPLPADSPLWEAPNLFVTPHCAAVSDPRALAGLIASNIEAHERGEGLRDLVDLGRGY